MRTLQFFIPSNRTTPKGNLRGFDGMNEIIKAARTNKHVAARQERENLEHVIIYTKRAMLQHRFKPIHGKATVHIEMIEPNYKRDVSNVLGATKYLLDGITCPRGKKPGAGLITDDSPKWCVLTATVKVVSGSAGAVITVKGE